MGVVRTVAGFALVAAAVAAATGCAGGRNAGPKPSASASHAVDIVVDAQSMSAARAGTVLLDVRNAAHTARTVTMRLRFTVPGADTGKLKVTRGSSGGSGWDDVPLTTGPAPSPAAGGARIADPVTLTGAYPLTLKPGENRPGLRVAPAFRTSPDVTSLHLALDLLDAKGRVLAGTTNEVQLNLVDVARISAPAVLPRDGKWHAADFTVANASTTAQPSVRLGASADCDFADGARCPTSGAYVKGLRVQWFSGGRWHDMPAKGAALPRVSLPAGASRTVRMRLAATTRFDPRSRYALFLDVGVPGRDGGPLSSTGGRATMTVR
ncbi:hypothetical protein [Streptomyces sp. DW26H14]|uniref:hypothetical protein n=1 Tax=Streptomyces sp. DW26H14 TaxID=3435395 RepID=UPI00403E291E